MTNRKFLKKNANYLFYSFLKHETSRISAKYFRQMKNEIKSKPNIKQNKKLIDEIWQNWMKYYCKWEFNLFTRKKQRENISRWLHFRISFPTYRTNNSEYVRRTIRNPPTFDRRFPFSYFSELLEISTPRQFSLLSLAKFTFSRNDITSK